MSKNVKQNGSTQGTDTSSSTSTSNDKPSKFVKWMTLIYIAVFGIVILVGFIYIVYSLFVELVNLI